DEEWRTRSQRAQQPTDRWSEHEAETEGRADDAEVLRALLRRSDVGDVRIRGRVGRARDACDEAPGEQPREPWRESHDDVVDAEREQRRKQHRAASESIAEIADHRRAEELRDCVDEVQPAAETRGLAQAR